MGDLPSSFIVFLPDSSYGRTGGKRQVMRFQNWPLGYEIQKALATPKCLLMTMVVLTHVYIIFDTPLSRKHSFIPLSLNMAWT